MKSIGEVSRQLDIAAYRIGYAHANGKVPEPKCRIAGKRVYDENEVAALAVYFDVPLMASEESEPKEDDDEI